MSSPAHPTDMDRRTLLRVAPLVALAGCTGAGGGDGGDGSPQITDRAFTDTGECASASPETATVDASSTAVRIGGCITGPNGCAVATLDSATVEGDELVVVVTTTRDAPPDAACTEALVYRSYGATITLDHRVSSVRVIHDTPSGRETVVDHGGESGEAHGDESGESGEAHDLRA